MEKVQYLLVRLEHTGLAIGDRMLLAESLDERLCPSQVVPGHGWEQMMLDLIVQSAIPKVDQRRTLDVAGRKHLLTEEIRRAVLVHNRHPFMVGGADRTEVQPKERVMDDDEQEHLPEAQPPEQQANVESVMEGQQQRLGQDVLCFLPAQEEDTQDQERHRGENIYRELEVGLVFRSEPRDPLLAPRHFFSKGGEWPDDVRIETELVGMTMMGIVLIDPPAPTPTNQQIPH